MVKNRLSTLYECLTFRTFSRADLRFRPPETPARCDGAIFLCGLLGCERAEIIFFHLVGKQNQKTKIVETKGSPKTFFLRQGCLVTEKGKDPGIRPWNAEAHAPEQVGRNCVHAGRSAGGQAANKQAGLL